MRIAFVGSGYVADFYVRTLANYPQLSLAGVFDRDRDCARRFTEFYKVRSFGALNEILQDPTIELIANLTNPHGHFAVSKAALQAGKHVYSEKPLAMCLDEAEELVSLADQRGLLLASAPCNVLSETAQTLWKAVREELIGTPRLVFAELHDAIFFLDYKQWATESGAPWPFHEEFEVGCTLEHAGYYLGMLTAMFGPATRVSSYANVLQRHKGTSGPYETPDFTVGIIEFASGVVARLTCDIYATTDHSLRIFGDDGVLSIPDCWNYGAPVCLDSRIPKTWQEKHPRRARLFGRQAGIPLVRPANFAFYDSGHKMDFCRGIAELADAISEKRRPRLSAQWSLHVNELALAISKGIQSEIRTTFEPMAPMPWSV